MSQSAPFSNAIFNNVLTYNVSGGYYTVSANISYKKSDGSTYSNTVFRGGTGTVEVGIPAGTGEVTFTESITGNYETVSKYIRSTFRVYCPQIGLDKTDTGIFSSNSDTLKISGGDISKLIKNTQFSLTITAEDS